MKIKIAGFYIVLALLIFGLYANILNNIPTDWDDGAIFSGRYTAGITLNSVINVFTYNNGSTFQPIRDFSYLVDFSLWGKNVKTGIHIQSIFLYLLMNMALSIFLIQLFIKLGFERITAINISFITTLIFAAHPVHSEAVAWMFARKEPLMGMFSFLSLWAFLKTRNRIMLMPAITDGNHSNNERELPKDRDNPNNLFYYFLCIISLILAVLSKPVAVVLPFVIIFLDIIFILGKKDNLTLIKRLAVYFILLGIAVPFLVSILTTATSAGTIKSWNGDSFFNNLFAVSQILLTYIKLIGFNFNYCADYTLKLFAGPHFWQAWIFVFLNVLLAGACLYCLFKRYFITAFFIFWYYIFLMPVSHILPIYQKLTDRYAMMSTLSWCVLLGYMVVILWQKELNFKSFSLRKAPRVVSLVFFISLMIFYSYTTVRQNSFWKDSYTLWNHTLSYYPYSNPANTNISAILISQGRFQEAKEHARKAIKTIPYDYNAINNLALAQMFLKQYDVAITNFKIVTTIRPDMIKSWISLAETYWRKKAYVESAKVYKKMISNGIDISQQPYADSMLYRLALDAWLFRSKNEAMDLLKKALNASKGDPSVLIKIAVLYKEMGEMERAADVYELARRGMGRK